MIRRKWKNGIELGGKFHGGVPPLLTPSVIAARYVLLILGACHTSFLCGDCLGRSTRGGGGINDENNAFPCFILFHFTPGFPPLGGTRTVYHFEGWKNGRKGGERCVTGVETYLTIMTLSTYGTRKEEKKGSTFRDACQ